ncbi:MAG: TRAM domain-containing protein [Thermoproteota archaeon]
MYKKLSRKIGTWIRCGGLLVTKKSKRGSFRKPPIKENEVYHVTIESINHRGEGVARIRGFVVLIPGAVAGERVRVRIVSVRPRFAVGEALR